MIKAHELAVSNSCLNKAQADEPLFVLRANDPLFSAIVRLWAMAAHGVHEEEKRTEAYALAADGDAWWREHQPKEIPAATGSGAGGGASMMMGAATPSLKPVSWRG